MLLFCELPRIDLNLGTPHAHVCCEGRRIFLWLPTIGPICPTDTITVLVTVFSNILTYGCYTIEAASIISFVFEHAENRLRDSLQGHSKPFGTPKYRTSVQKLGDSGTFDVPVNPLLDIIAE